jgi:hypothetical protein
MALEYVNKWFSKVGRGVPQTEQVDEDGKPKTDEKGNAVIGNEQYQAKQLVSVPSDSPEDFLAAALEATEGDIGLVASSFLSGFNKYLRLKAGGLDEYQKAARGIIKLGLPQFKGMSVDEVAEYLKNAEPQK